MTLKGANILVTGATGLIGSNLVAKIGQNYDCNLSVTQFSKPITPSRHTVYTGDLLDVTFCDTITKGKDIVFHCAAYSFGSMMQEQDPVSFIRPNMLMNLNLLESCYKNGVKKFIWLASTTGYPDADFPVNEELMFTGDPYDKYFAVGWMKRYTEKLCQMYSEKLRKKLTCIVLRPSNIYGPNDKIDPNKSHVLTALIRKVAEKQNPIVVWGDGTDVRDFLYVDDMIDAMLLSAENVEQFSQINIGYGQTYSVLEALSMIKKVTGYDAPIQLHPTGPRMIPIRKITIDKASRLLGWSPKTNIEDGILHTYNWVKTKI